MSSASLDLVSLGSVSMDRRKEYFDLMVDNPELREAELLLCKESVAHWVNHWCYTCDPRDRRVYPFDLWPKQEQFLAWVGYLTRNQVRGACKKSRDGGFSWLCCAVAVHGLIFQKHFTCGFGSRKLEYVDRLGDLKSLFEKCRFLLYSLPWWMLPRDYNRQKDDNHCRILNREVGSAIVGEGGDSIGRGDRTTLYFVDESAFLEHAEMAETALSATTNVRIDISSVNGPATVFSQVFRRLPPEQRFVAHWTDDPRKDEEWAAKKREEIGEVAFASEYDGDESASVENLVIPARWVAAAVNLVLPPPGTCWNVNEPNKDRCKCWEARQEYEGQQNKNPLRGFWCPDCGGSGLVPRKGVPRWQGRDTAAGFDVAEEGKDLCVVICREGPVVLPEWITSWGKLDTTQSAWKARDWIEDWCLANLDLSPPPPGSVGTVLMTPVPSFVKRLTCNYDAGGPGVGVKGTWNNSDEPLLFDVVPVLFGGTCSEDAWEDGKTSREKFANLRAEMWWKLRKRFEKTYAWVMHQQDPEDPRFSRGGDVPLDELVSIPDHAQLRMELSLPTYHMTSTGKIALDPKSELKKSPDFGDALALAFWEGDRKREVAFA